MELFLILALYLYDNIYSPFYNLRMAYRNESGDSYRSIDPNPTWYNNEYENDEWTMTLSLLNEMAANGYTKNLDYYEALENEIRELNEMECDDEECLPSRVKRRFCMKCGICTAIRVMRRLLYVISLHTPEQHKRPVREAYKEEIWFVHDPHTAMIRRYIEECPEVCPKEMLRVRAPLPPPPEYLQQNDNRTFKFVFHFPTAYRCERRRPINPICIDSLYWLRKIDAIDFQDSIRNLSAPVTAICLYEDDEIYNNEMYWEYEPVVVVNEEI